MRKVFITLGWLWLLQIPSLYGQSIPNPDPRPTQYLEGARLVVDILKLFRSETHTPPRRSRQEKSAGKQACDFCLVNSDSTNKIKVSLVNRQVPNADTIYLVIGPGEKACSLQITCGVYNCKIQFPWDEIISWGDIYVQSKLVQVERTATRTKFPE